MEQHYKECQEWLLKAAHDERSAKILLKSEFPVTDTACFHCQQAVEKLLKAYLVYKEEKFAKVHNVSYLLDLCSDLDNSFEEIRENIEELAPFAVEVRYPGSCIDIPLNEANAIFKSVLKCRQFIVELLSESLKIYYNKAVAR